MNEERSCNSKDTIQEIKRKIEIERKAVGRLYEEGRLDESYQRNLLLDKLIEQYLDIMEETASVVCHNPPPDTTNE